jgi:hypothetical protein
MTFGVSVVGNRSGLKRRFKLVLSSQDIASKLHIGIRHNNLKHPSEEAPVRKEGF